MFRFFESLIEPFPAGEVHAPPRGFCAFIYHYSRPVLPWIALMSVLAALISSAEVAFIGYTGLLVDWLGSPDHASFFPEHGAKLFGVGLLVGVGFPLLVLAQSLLSNQTIFENYPTLVRWLGHRHLLGQSLRFFQDEFAGRISQRLLQTAVAIRVTVMKLMDVFVYVIVYFAGTAILVGRIDARLTLPLVVWLAGYICIVLYFVPRVSAVSKTQAEARAEMTGRIVDSYTNIQTVKLFAHTLSEQAYARDATGRYLHAVQRQMRLVTGINVSLQTLNSLLLVSVTAATLLIWHESAISVGAIAMAIAAVMRIRSMSASILWELAVLFENIGTVQDGVHTLARPIDLIDRPNATELVVPRGEIRFEKIRFRYTQTDVIEDVSLLVRPGEKIGLVGRSAAGKSTLVNLLLRFYDLEAGRILIDHQDIAGVAQESLRRHIGVVTQDTSLLHRSIRDNIRYGRPDASEAEILEAARRAQADAFIGELEDHNGRTGYDAYVGERGVKLSGGQRQRIAIARVLLKDAPILVLDEATSALDSETEAAIQEQLYSLMQGKTVIAIAHRLSTIAALDRLVVLDEGRIVENGTHEELLRERGLYAALWQRQSRGFLGADATTPERRLGT